MSLSHEINHDFTPYARRSITAFLETMMRRNVLVTTMAVNILTATPIESVSAKPRTMKAPNVPPSQKRITQAIRVVILLSLIADHARVKPISTAACNDLPARSSSLSRSKMSTLASTAMPSERMNAAMPGSVSVSCDEKTLNSASSMAP